MRNNHNNNWHRKEIERLDRLLHAEKELKRMLAKMLDNHDKDMAEHRKWLRQHEVRLTEHWKQIARLKEK